MASEIKNLLPLGSNWLIEVAEDDPVPIETFLHNGDGQTNENNQGFKLPDVIGILPIRNAVAYPGTITPLAIGRKRSKALLADTTPNESIIGLLTQRNPNTDKVRQAVVHLPKEDQVTVQGGIPFINRLLCEGRSHNKRVGRRRNTRTLWRRQCQRSFKDPHIKAL